MLAALFAMRDPSSSPFNPAMPIDGEGADRAGNAAAASTSAATPRAGWVSRPMSDAARAILNEPGEWESQRAPARVGDQMIHPHTQAWLRSLPGSRWPMNLASRFPRVANHLALVWPDRVLCERAFERLLQDERGGRQGFPAMVQAELVALRRLRMEQSYADAPRAPWGGLRLVDSAEGREQRKPGGVDWRN